MLPHVSFCVLGAQSKWEQALLQVKILKGLKAGTAREQEAYEELRKELRAEHPDHLPVFLEGLKRSAGKLKTPYGSPAAPAPSAGGPAGAEAGADDAAAAEVGDTPKEPSQEEIAKDVLAASDEVRSAVARGKRLQRL